MNPNQPPQPPASPEPHDDPEPPHQYSGIPVLLGLENQAHDLFQYIGIRNEVEELEEEVNRRYGSIEGLERRYNSINRGLQQRLTARTALENARANLMAALPLMGPVLGMQNIANINAQIQQHNYLIERQQEILQAILEQRKHLLGLKVRLKRIHPNPPPPPPGPDDDAPQGGGIPVA